MPGSKLAYRHITEAQLGRNGHKTLKRSPQHVILSECVAGNRSGYTAPIAGVQVRTPRAQGLTPTIVVLPPRFPALPCPDSRTRYVGPRCRQIRTHNVQSAIVTGAGS